ncbi:MAG TPA: GNAT family N-acetyltransferase [Crocinitomix sp.]|nr:GNAT family N-acetyltransferase [Crocinitomix sp.]
MSKDLSYILPSVELALLEKELNKDRFVRFTSKLNNEIYIVNQHNSPNVIKEIGRLRELTFATAGGGTGNPIDIDEYDTNENCYQQLIVWAPDTKEIVGGYRFIDCKTAIKNDKIDLSTRHYFEFSDKFIKNYLPKTIELGRSWVQPKYQPTNSRRGLFSLDNLWDGLGAIVVNNPQIEYFFGKVTMYENYDVVAKKAVLAFMNAMFPDNENLVTPIHPVYTDIDQSEILKLITLPKGTTPQEKQNEFKTALKVLQQFVRERGEKIPPLINNYMQLSPSMKSFGTALNPDFGGVEETGILVKIPDIYDEKKERHLNY